MELTHLNQIEFQELQFEKIDCIFSAIADQPRCLFLAETLERCVRKKILLLTGDEENKVTEGLKKRFDELGFLARNAPLNDQASFDLLLGEICNIKAHQVNIAIDYSCMPKKWYAQFIDCITRNSYSAEKVNLFLSYTPKVYERKPGKHAIEYFGPILFNRDKLKDKKPVSLLISLDHNSGPVYDVVNKIKPRKLLVFIPNCSHDPDYSAFVSDQNRTLLKNIDPENVIRYECDRPDEINSLLTSRCLDERIDSEVVIVPQGPKIFSIVSMLLSVRYPDIKLWEIIFKDRRVNGEDGKAAANPVIVKVSFINDELD